MDITLTVPEWHHAIQTAALRFTISRGSRIANLSTDERSWSQWLDYEIGGAAAEVAVFKALGVYHVGSVNTFHRVPDCIADTEIRSTRRMDGSLILRSNDDDARRFILVIGE